MTTPFGKRVDILTDWHNRFPDANVDLLAELVLDVWQKAEEYTEERIIKLLLDNYQERLSDGSRVPNNHNDGLDETIALIKEPTRNITSEILPDGSIYIEEIKGEK